MGQQANIDLERLQQVLQIEERKRQVSDIPGVADALDEDRYEVVAQILQDVIMDNARFYRIPPVAGVNLRVTVAHAVLNACRV